MNSAHSEGRNLAHCATTAMANPQQVGNNEVAKLKEDYERQIQTLKLEHKIQLLEMDNKMSKQENDNKTKILELQKENQSLKHENELMKLKGAHELNSNKMAADATMEKQWATKEIERNAKEIEFRDELNKKDKELLRQENEHKIDMIKMKNEMEKTIESLRNENEMLKAKVQEQPMKMVVGDNAEKEEQPKEMDQPVALVARKEEPLKLPLMERLEWGVKCFITKKFQQTNQCSYEQWYQSICSIMQNKMLYDNNDFLLVKKNFARFETRLWFVCKDKGSSRKESPNNFQIEGLNNEELDKGVFFILHPQNEEKKVKHVKRFKIPESNYGISIIYPLTFIMEMKNQLLFSGCLNFK